jgi:uncharacterized protein YcfL
MSSLHRLLPFAAALAALALAGCQTPEGARTPVNTTRHNLEDTEVFVLMDGPTQRSVTTSGVQQRINADGRLEVAANIRNRESRRIEVQWQVVFKDAQGFSIGDETPWQTIILTENAQETIRAISMNEQARRYTFRVRQAR